MGPLQWTAEISVFDANMDAEHQSVFQSLDHLRQRLLTGARQQEVDRNLQSLSNQLGAHFLEEERLMRKSRYSGLNWHESQHRAGLINLLPWTRLPGVSGSVSSSRAYRR